MPKPLLQALLLADHVYKDAFSGKMVIAGTFNRVILLKDQEAETGEGDPQSSDELARQAEGLRKLRAHEVMRAGSPFAYISLTDVRGKVPLELRYVDLTDNRVILTVRFDVSSDTPLATIEQVIQMPPFLAPHEGVFALELLHDNEPLGSHRVTVDVAPGAEAGEEKKE